ncbi:MAG TPA: hemolysin family protein [Longimicrobiales bacterium]|nr:hemolysin family protein [Longimicrobiales bacterium]
MIVLVLALFLALLLSAFFTAAELSVFSVPQARIAALLDAKQQGSAALAELRNRPGRVLVLLRLGDSLADLAAGVITGYLAYLEWNVLGAIIAVVLIAVVIVFIGELAPLTVAMNRGVSVALLISRPLRMLIKLFGPIIAPLEKLSGVIPVRSLDFVTSLTETNVRELGVMGHSAGQIEEHERQLIARAFQLDETKAWNIMTPRVDIFALEDSMTLSELANELDTFRHTRVPVYGESIDDITGIVYRHDVYQALVRGQRDLTLRSLARDPVIVPGSISVTKLLREFQTRRVHLAIVVDEYGGTDGLVTLEDVLEELVGEIVDEKDVAEDLITRVSRTEIIAQGEVDLREINNFFHTAFPQLEHRSLNGYLLEELGRVPDAGETLEREGVMIEVLDATDTQVVRARLQRTPPAAAAGKELSEKA